MGGLYGVGVWKAVRLGWELVANVVLVERGMRGGCVLGRTYKVRNAIEGGFSFFICCCNPQGGMVRGGLEWFC